MQTFKEMKKRFQAFQAAQKQNDHQPDASASAPAPDSNVSVSSYPTIANTPPKHNFNQEQIEHIRRVQQKRKEKEEDDYNNNVTSRTQKIIQITNIREMKDGIMTAYNLAKEFKTVEAAMDFYKGVVWPLYEFYQFLNISPNKILAYHIDGRSVDQIKASLDWMIRNPNQKLINRRNPFSNSKFQSNKPYSTYKPPHKVEEEKLADRWARIRLNLQSGGTVSGNTYQDQRRDHNGRLEDISSIYDYKSDSDSGSGYNSDNGVYVQSSDEEEEYEVSHNSNSIIKINADGTHSRMRFNRSTTNSSLDAYSHNMYGNTPPEYDNIFGGLYGDHEGDDELPSYENIHDDGTKYDDLRLMWDNFMQNVNKRKQTNNYMDECSEYQADKAKFLEEYCKMYTEIERNTKRKINL